MTERSADERLRDALGSLADAVRADPADYGRASASWRRRHRRRRLVLAILAALVFTAADAVGLWALSSADPHVHVIFSDPRSPAVPLPADPVGAPGTGP